MCEKVYYFVKSVWCRNRIWHFGMVWNKYFNIYAIFFFSFCISVALWKLSLTECSQPDSHIPALQTHRTGHTVSQCVLSEKPCACFLCTVSSRLLSEPRELCYCEPHTEVLEAAGLNDLYDFTKRTCRHSLTFCWESSIMQGNCSHWGGR